MVTKSRQDKHEEFATDNSAVTFKLLGLAMKNLHKFYEMVLHKATSKVALSEEVRVYVNLDWRSHNREDPRTLQVQETIAEPLTTKIGEEK